MIEGEHGIQYMPCFSRIISEMLPEIHTTEMCYFLKSIIHFQFTSVLFFYFFLFLCRPYSFLFHFVLRIGVLNNCVDP